MRLRFLLAILLLTACNTRANERPANERGTLLQAQRSPLDGEKGNKKTLELVLLLGGFAFPVILVCCSEILRSIPVRRLTPDHCLDSVANSRGADTGRRLQRNDTIQRGEGFYLSREESWS